MRAMLSSAGFLAQDLAATLFFTGLLAATGNPVLAVGAGLAIGVAQLGYDLVRGRPVEALQWTSLALVVIAGATLMITHDARIVMIKPTLTYGAIAVSMLKRGWMNRYLPPQAKAIVPDLGVVFGYVWAGLMAATGLLSLALVLTVDLKTWGLVMSVAPLASKALLFVIQYRVMNHVGHSRYEADPAAGAALLAAA